MFRWLESWLGRRRRRTCTMKGEVGWSKSCLAANKGTHRIKGKILHLCLRCRHWNSGKWMLLTVSEKWASKFSMLTQKDWNMVNNYTGRYNAIPVVGEMVIEWNRLHRALQTGESKHHQISVGFLTCACHCGWIRLPPEIILFTDTRGGSFLLAVTVRWTFAAALVVRWGFEEPRSAHCQKK